LTQPDAPIRNVSDTAAWAAWFRALESKRPDALFRDPYAERLAGERGARIVSASPRRAKEAWAWTARTVAFDELLRAELQQGTDLVVNLAAGLDARPYRMELLPELRWVEVDMPALLDAKEQALAGERPRCRLERVRLDLADRPARRQLFARLASEAKRAVVISEGLLIYLDRAQVGELASDLHAVPTFQRWLVDLVSPGLLERMTKVVGDQLQAAQALFRFGPPEGPEFFVPFGWRPRAVRSLLKTAASHRRLPFLLRLVALLPEPPRPQGKRPWSAVCLLGRD
jgi:methyltransferase (TIGR00027 family)